jgi:hypothetical protein
VEGRPEEGESGKHPGLQKDLSSVSTSSEELSAERQLLTSAKAHPSHVSEALFIIAGGRLLNQGRKMLTAYREKEGSSARLEKGLPSDAENSLSRAPYTINISKVVASRMMRTSLTHLMPESFCEVSSFCAAVQSLPIPSAETLERRKPVAGRSTRAGSLVTWWST